MSLASQVNAAMTRIATEIKTIRSSFVPNTRTVAGKALSANVTIGATDLSATGTKDASTFLRGDNTWATPSGGSGASIVLLGPEDPVPGGTPAGLVIRLADTP